jgi:sorbitol-specific phosphotransferase system component IIA
MVQVFKAKVRPIGSSAGIIIPQEVLLAEKLAPGEEAEFAVIHRNFALLDNLMGTMKGAKPFVRDRRDRI